MKKLNCALLIDDDSISNFINERLIRKIAAPEQLTIALNGEEALKYILRSHQEKLPHPDLILLDINMPVMDGFEFLKEFKQLNLPDKSSVVIIMLTTSTSPNDTERLNDSGAAGYINKPLTEEKLRLVMEEFFSK